MAIKKFESKKAKPGWKFDGRVKKYVSWGFEFWVRDKSKKYGRRRITESGFATRELADRALAKIKTDDKRRKYGLSDNSAEEISLFDLCQKRIKSIENKKESVRAKTILQRWLDLLPSGMTVGEVKSKDIGLYIESRAGDTAKRSQKPPKASSVNREITVIAATLHAAGKLFPELENYVAPSVPRPKVSRARRERIITEEEMNLILSELFKTRRKAESEADYFNRVTAGQVFRFALLTGARLGEIAAMRWEQIDTSGGIVQIVGTKSEFKSAAGVRYLEMTRSMREIFDERRRLTENSDFVFSRNGRSITRYHQIIKAACKKAGVKYGRNTPGGLTTHDARHTAVTRMLQAGIDLATVGAITGHSDKHLILHYSHATRMSRRAAIEVLEEFAGTKKKEPNLSLVKKQKAG